MRGFGQQAIFFQREAELPGGVFVRVVDDDGIEQAFASNGADVR